MYAMLQRVTGDMPSACFVRGHLHAWLRNQFPHDGAWQAKRAILTMVKDYPDLLNTHTWGEILNLADR